MDIALLNGHPKATIIERFNGEVVVVRPGFKKEFGRSVRDAQKFIEKSGWEMNIDILKGSPILRKMTE